MDIIEIIRRELERRGTNPFRAAKEAGLPGNAIRYVLDGHEPKVGRLAAICDALGLEFYVGPSRDTSVAQALRDSTHLATDEIVERMREAETDLERRVAEATSAASRRFREELAALLREQASEREGSPGLDDEEIPDLPGARYVEIHEVEAAAGSGANVEDAPVVGYVAFQRACLDLLRADPAQCTVIRAKGESMEPTLPDGCWVLVDRGRRRRLAGRIYLLRSEEGLVVKRLGKDEDGRWQLESDHPAWEAVPWPHDGEVIGEIRWTSRMFL